MELDDLKKSWNSQPIQTNKNTNIMELIQHKSGGPVAALKRGFKAQMRIMLLMPLFIFIANSMNAEGLLKSILFWSYVVFCVLVVAFFYFDYRIATRMEVMEGAVKANLEKQTLLLEKRLRWKMIGLPIAMLFFILLVEVLPYVQHYKMLNTWHNLSPFIRFGAYAFLLLFQYVVSRRINERRFGAHLRHLKELVKEMQD
ncbi:MAG TPA: hypothetical protein VEY10_01865 [Flavisolibacter sp.]|jgi:hypothetical protein|nr:hypothetical protein [Flavisolibacter sp.]